MPLDGPEKARLWSPDGLDDSVRCGGHRLKARRKIPQCLVVVAVDGVWSGANRLGQRSCRNNVHLMHGFLVRRKAMVLDLGGSLLGQVLP